MTGEFWQFMEGENLVAWRHGFCGCTSSTDHGPFSLAIPILLVANNLIVASGDRAFTHSESSPLKTSIFIHSPSISSISSGNVWILPRNFQAFYLNSKFFLPLDDFSHDVINITCCFIIPRNLHVFFILCHCPSDLKWGPITSFLHLSKPSKVRLRNSSVPCPPEVQSRNVVKLGTRSKSRVFSTTLPCKRNQSPGEEAPFP